jgi:hypothetical protein
LDGRVVVSSADRSIHVTLFERRRWPFVETPTWSPDGEQLAISAAQHGGLSQILIIDVADAS